MYYRILTDAQRLNASAFALHQAKGVEALAEKKKKTKEGLGFCFFERLFPV